MSPEEAVDAADQQVYALVSERRAELFATEDAFSIEAPADSLRRRLLAGEEQAVDAVLDLDLRECLEIASENNRQFRSQRESLYLSALDLTLERWRFGWQPSAGAGAGVNGDLGEGSDNLDGSIDGAFSLTRLFGNGGRLVVDIGAALFGAIAQGEGWDAVSNLGISWSQPLLRGSAREIVLEPLTQAERNLVYSVRSFERFRRTFALDVASRYYNLVLTRQNVINERENIDALELLSRRNQAHAEAGKLSELEASEAAQSLISSRNRLLSLEAGYQAQLDNFKLFLGLPIEIQIGLDPAGLSSLSVDDVDVQIPALQEEALVRVALTHRLDYLNEVERLVDSERQVRIAADDLRAGLGFSASTSGSSESGQPLAYRSDGSAWSLSLDLDLPVDQLPERNSYRRSLISLQADQRSVVESQDTIRADIRDALREIELTRRTFELQQETVALNRRRARSANMNLEAGRSETRFVLDAQRDLTAALNAADGALVDYTLARLQLMQQLELLFVGEAGLAADWERLAALPLAEPESGTESDDGE